MDILLLKHGLFPLLHFPDFCCSCVRRHRSFVLCPSGLVGFVRSAPESMSFNVIPFLRVTEELVEVVGAQNGWVSRVC